ncbi:uncharacterized mitochondrial protein AtMg00810-like [Lathyrus oleraceus]|uniref:uncharacterized mitochondrial protein AtMg00810-like n=1 Tax=Pisum sativum TaxID=3888 RepID=UPI0021D36531|nr:uncharacterized mitochondrial protein AtMg00810-like [Pisum sativum]
MVCFNLHVFSDLNLISSHVFYTVNILCLLQRVQVYVDDIIFGSTNIQLVKEFSKLMQVEFEMSLMGELNYFPGLQIKQLNKGTFVCQTKYCNELLKKFGMVDAKPIDTPMPTNGNSEKYGNGKDVDVKKYRGMIGSLIYLTASTSDITFSVCMCVCYQSTHKQSDMKVVKRILRYLHATYTDSDFSSCK